MSLSIEIENLQPLLAALEAYPDKVAPELQRAADAALLSLVADLANYPPAPPQSRYKRTGTLGRLWSAARPVFQAMRSGFDASLGNATAWGPYVQDGEQQAWMHQDVWETVEDVLAEHADKIEGYFDAALERVIARGV